jgi:AraC-like DNA-binding protein
MIFKDKLFYKYLTVSEETKKWGLYLTGAGYAEVCGEDEYPCLDHPEHHYFHWSTGRRISDYQILYISKGKGIFESEASGKKKVKAGDMFLLFPNIWHRFSPNKSTGWNECWIEFNGVYARHLQDNKFLNPSEPVIKLGVMEEQIDKYLKVIKLVRDEDLTIQYLASGILLQLIGKIQASKISVSFNGQDVENQIRQAKEIISENINQSISPEKIANELGISYSLFRKQFRKYTGFSPIQYQIQLRVQEAKKLLLNTDKPIKEVAHMLGFESTCYFSRLFKQKIGKSPTDIRTANIR